ncbi:collagenase [Bacillus spongiae]|uniref:microbial collagenase n=1 Tax=Bacillus spongiae TaxID=2683610 RepID=A0ABU8HIF1_9BACI
MDIPNKKLIGKLCSSLLVVTLLFPGYGTSYAQEKEESSPNRVKKLNDVSLIVNDRTPLKRKRAFIDTTEMEETKHIKQHEKLPSITPSAPPSQAQTESLQSMTLADNHTFSELLTYTDDELVELLATISTNNITDFWSYSDDAVAFYRDRNRLLTLRDAIIERGSSYTNRDDLGLATLIEVLNRGFYIGFDYGDTELAYLEDLSFRNEMNSAIKAVVNNQHFELGTDSQERVLEQIGFLMNHGTPDVDMFNALLPVVQDFNSHVNTYITDFSKTDAIYALLNGFEYNLYYNFLNESYRDVQDAPWHGRVDNLLNEIATIIEFTQFSGTDHEWLIDNGIWIIGEEGRFHSDPNFSIDVFSGAINVFPKYTGLYLAIADRLEGLGGNINYDQIIKDYEDYYYGEHYVFDDGEIIIKAGDRVTTEEIQKIYWAAKEEKAQFHRYYGTDTPVEQGNADDVLTTIIYNDKEEYKLNRYINGVGTDNGGIYIESWGTFFTWDREVPADSIFELEELFRHEYFHYLQSRYVVPGLWGSTPLYTGDRIAWFEEGGGEFFAGSTRTGIEPRSTMVEGIAANPADRYTLDQVLHASYSLGWEFYDYSYAFYDFIINNHMDIFYTINELVKNEDGAGFDRYMDELSRNSSLEKEFQAHLSYLYNNLDQYGVPSVSNDYLLNHSVKSLIEIENEIITEINLNNVSQDTFASEFFDTYTLTGEYVGGTSGGEVADFEDINQAVNQVISELSRTGKWSGYKTLTAYFVNHRVNSRGQYVYDVVFHGMYTGNTTATNLDPVAIIGANSQGTVNNPIQFSSTDAYDPDGSIVEFEWDFGDGNSSIESNPSHIYTEAGTYTVRLTVTDNKGAFSSSSMRISINDGNVTTETESNNRQSEANVMGFGDQLEGSLDYATGNDHTDWYYFDVDERGEVTIDVTKLSGTDFNVLVEDANGNRLAEPLNNPIFNASPGRYYIVVYTWSGEWVDYSIALNGNQPDTGGSFDTETEPNNRKSAANLINTQIGGALDYATNDHTDWFYFDVETSSEVMIQLTKLSGTDYNVLVEDDNGNVIANPLVDHSFHVSPGRYYVSVYTWEGNAVEYKMELTK